MPYDAAMSMPDFSVVEMQSLSLANSGLRRDAIVPPAFQPEGFGAAYDWTTLSYDAVRSGNRILLVCPKLLNFSGLIRDGALRLDDHPARIRRLRRYRRHDIVEIAAEAGATRLSITHDGWSATSGISPDMSAIFAGLNASLHISRNNRLDWIADWARFHRSEHGLEAMLVMDNASDAYPPEAILEALAATGLKRAVVLKVPQPYGPVRSKSGGGGAKFLQPAMLNLARLRFLSRARAVLNVDIDELVWSRAGSVFDAALRSPFGMVVFDGEWRSPAAGREPPLGHADHIYAEAELGPCPTKYCIRPDGWRRYIGWDVHRPDVLLPFGWLKRSDFGYWHCRTITTNWKNYNRLGYRPLAEPDPFTARTLALRLPAA